MRDFIEFVLFLALATVLVVTAVSGLIVAESYGIERPSCYAHWSASEYKARWSFFGDCQISKDGLYWTPEKAYLELHKDVKVSQ